ncbi:MAG: helix-hairpin-helix domain-containing protein, partial [Pseudomonadota bacterium]
PWVEDEASFIVNALSPAEVSKVVLDEDAERIEVVVPAEQLSLAIGRRGQNVRLASQLTGWDIDILTEDEESERRQAEFNERSQMFMESLDVDEVIAQLLATEGFTNVEEVAYVDPSEVASIEGFDEDTAEEIQARAREHLEALEAQRDARRRELGVSDDLANISGMTTAMMVALGENDVKTLDDFADCATDDLIGWVERPASKGIEAIRHKGYLDGFDVNRLEAEEMILAARILLGWIGTEDLVSDEPVYEDGADIPVAEDGEDAEGAEAATDVAEPETADADGDVRTDTDAPA